MAQKKQGAVGSAQTTKPGGRQQKAPSSGAPTNVLGAKLLRNSVRRIVVRVGRRELIDRRLEELRK